MATYGLMMSMLGVRSVVPVIVGVLVIGVLMLAFTLMLVQVTISEVARPELRATGLGGYGTALAAGLGGGPIIAGWVADSGGLGWAFAVIGAVGVGVALVAAVVLARARRRPLVVVFV